MSVKLTDDNRLSIQCPAIAQEWHPRENGDLTPNDVAYGSGIKRWWECLEGHVWQASPNSRTSGNGTGCPYCAGKRVTRRNMLTICHPDISDEWHPTKNGDMTPDQFSRGSGKVVWWQCTVGHERQMPIYQRTGKRRRKSCPDCARITQHLTDDNRLSALCPELTVEWHQARNGDLTPYDVSYASARRVWWKCPKGHEWEAAVMNRGFHRAGCPTCARLTDANRLSQINRKVASEWHPTENGELTPDDVTFSSHKKVWWLCPEGHKWSAIIKNRCRLNSGCPYCAGKEVSNDNRLSDHYPEVAAQWHPSKNGQSPAEVSYGSAKKAWWMCEETHEWKAVISSRTQGHGCPYCAGVLVSDANRLPIKCPAIAKEWHPVLNGDLTPDKIALASNKRVWWKCPKGHEWEAVVASRTIGGNGCRYCTLTGRSAVEIRLACELLTFFSDITPEKTTRITTLQGPVDADIAIPSHNLIIEYDGQHWHKNEFERDNRKTQAMKSAGWRVLRIRERPLRPVQPSDMACEVTFPKDIKRLVDGVLHHLGSSFGIGIEGLSEYLQRKSPVNGMLANRIIASIDELQLPLFE